MAYIAEKYAPLLSKDDVIELFQRLQRLCRGNLSEACRRCGIQRKTTYDWMRAKSIKLSTKKKILKAMIETNTEQTINFLLSRSKEITVELLSTYLSYLYSEAMKEIIDPQYFLRIVKKFEKTKSDYVGLIWELEEEVEEMTYNLRERARDLKVSLPEEPIDTIRSTHLLEILPSVIYCVTRDITGDPAKLASSLGVPKMLVQVVSGAIATTLETQHTVEAGKVNLPFVMGNRSPTTVTEYTSPPDISNQWST
ncbi:hypothetical protein DRO19_03610 [Candidatus Bathyarchaeota archaeon]|nr:MAG: hypothetical protein DRO19_03610 [Candidatus Bathyarchaeota archaeon]